MESGIEAVENESRSGVTPELDGLLNFTEDAHFSALDGKLADGLTVCADVSGRDTNLLIMLHKKFGCRIDLIALSDQGEFGTDPADVWPDDIADALQREGVPADQVRICREVEQSQKYDLVCSVGRFGLTADAEALRTFLENSLVPGGQILTDIGQSSGGFRFFRDFGTTQTIEEWTLDGMRVVRTLVTGTIETMTKDSAITRVVDEDSWAYRVNNLVGSDGLYKENGKHSFAYIPRGPVLCVTFDNLDIAMNKREDRLPWGYSFIEKQGWSMLGVMAEGWTWYREAWVSEQFDELKRTGFFRQFEKVIFYGASMGAYGALVFSAACPGAHVVAFSPQTTLDKSVVPWEERYKAAWGYDYSGPYGDAAGTTAPAARVNLFYDPYSKPDKAHIDRLSGNNLVHFRCPFLGHRLGSLLQQMGLLQPLVLDAMNGTLTPDQLSRELRVRHDQRRYRKELVGHALERNHPGLAARLCEYSLQKAEDKFFRTTLADLNERAIDLDVVANQ